MTTTINGTTGVSLIQDGIVTSAKIVDGSVLPVDTQVGALPSMVRLNTANGYGSTNTKIRRFTNIVTNQGSDITYADSATLGATFTINTNGVYAISFTEQGNAATTVAITLNTTQPTVDPSLLTNISEILCISTTPANSYSSCASGVFYLVNGSVIRPHTGGLPSGPTVSENIFTITRVA